MSGSAQVERLLSLVPYLQSHPGVSLSDTAARFGITERQLRQDLDVVYMCGLPGLMPGDMIDVDMEAVEGEGLIYLDNADVLARPLRLTADEAAALVLALNAVADLADSETAAAVQSALTKLQAALGAQPGGTIEVAGGAVGIRDAVNRAIAVRRRLAIRYDGPQRTTRPTVEPARVVIRDGIAYLQAWAPEREDWRLYRLERIGAAEVLDEPVAEREPPDVDDDWSERLAGAGEVTLTLAPEAAWVAEYYPTRRTEPAPDGGVTVTFGVSDPAWLTALLLRLGPGVRGCDPSAAAVPARAAAREALAQYRGLCVPGVGSE